MEDNDSCFKTSLQLFFKLGCCSSNLNGDFNDVDAGLVLVCEDKMRCHIITCLIALYFVMLQKKTKVAIADKDNREFVKSKVFTAAISMISDDDFDSDEAVVKTILPLFLDKNRVGDKQSWLPQQFTIALAIRNKISDDSVRIMLTAEPLAVDQLNKKEVDDEDEDEDEKRATLIAYTPTLKNPGARILRGSCGRCALHFVAQYSESLGLLQDILRIDHNMIRMSNNSDFEGNHIMPLGLLCSRLHFPTFDKMVLCLIEANSTVAVIADGMIGCLRSYKKVICPTWDWMSDGELFKEGSRTVSSKSTDERSLTLFRTLLDANPAVVRYDRSLIFHEACRSLKGELCISVLSLFLKEDNNALKTRRNYCLPIHVAGLCSCVDVLKFLHKAYPESISMLYSKCGPSDRLNLLHGTIIDNTSDTADVVAKVQYICDHCPALIHSKNKKGETPLHYAMYMGERFNFECIKTLCDIDSTVVRDKTGVQGTVYPTGQLPLHSLIENGYQMSEISNKGDCFRLLLCLYPAAAGIKDDSNEDDDEVSSSPYDMAISAKLSTYFMRLLLAADPTIDPVRRHDLNFTARRQGMFLAFSALSSNIEPIIWANLRLKGRDLLQHVISYL